MKNIYRKASIIAFAILCCISLYIYTVFAQETNILPGTSLGGVHLGIQCNNIKKEDLKFTIQDMVCDEEGKLTAIESNTGGSLYFGPFTVGTVNATQIITLLGTNYTARMDKEYSHSVAYYISYDEAGIAFRIVYLDKGDVDLLSSRSILQAIRVFVPTETKSGL